MKTKCHVIEEHNEALIVWIKYIKNNQIPPSHNILVHFDDHSDMSIPKFDESLTEIFQKSDDDIVDFVMRNITIETFIVSACFLKIFDKIDWIQIDGVTNSRQNYVTSYNDDGKNIISGLLMSEENPFLQNKISHRYTFNKFSEKTFSYNDSPDTVFFLDIDLDYFSCEVNPNLANEIVIEISKDEYDNFNSDFYHPVRYLVNRVEVMTQDEKYYLVINYYHDVIPSPRKVDNDTILYRLNDLKNKLLEIPVSPKIITICKSVNSGYLPEDQCEFILTNLINVLNEIYDLNVCYGY
ncbi:UPF0489 family protein [Chryseobacterium sp. NRRL B-14859]|uniref:UPF0489 family protein n=1 Tax=Chryseobacterium sp. NRRL B-14859 TaxID=1562763 RepID=UPI0033981F41